MNERDEQGRQIFEPETVVVVEVVGDTHTYGNVSYFFTDADGGELVLESGDSVVALYPKGSFVRAYRPEFVCALHYIGDEEDHPLCGDCDPEVLS